MQARVPTSKSKRLLESTEQQFVSFFENSETITLRLQKGLPFE